MNVKTHKCAAIGCTAQIKTNLLMCSAHWSELPPSLQVRIGVSFRGVKRGEENAVQLHRELVREAMGYLKEPIR